MNKFLHLIFLLIISPVLLISQSVSKDAFGYNYIQENISKLNVSADDASELIITDMYTSKHNGVTHIYYNQAFEGIPIHNAIVNLNVSKDNNVLYMGNRLMNDIASKISETSPQINVYDALQTQLEKADIVSNDLPVLKKQASNKYHFAETSYSSGDIVADLKYYPVDGKLVLAYEVKLLEKSKPHFWHTTVNAVTGELISHKDETLYCSFTKDQYHNHNKACVSHKHTEHFTLEEASPVSGSYRVYGLPVESPIHGSHDLVVQPHFPEASPYGWHDSDGVDGAEFTITRGNNVHAYRDGDDHGFSSGDEPNGGVDLIFDFPHNNIESPAVAQQADITNLFYMNNMMHDISYLFGFDEVSGNFQSNNYGKGGRDGDAVAAQGQDGANILDADHTNNANFSTPGDGNNGRMQMYFWSQSASSTSIDEPAELASDIEVTVPNNQGGDWGFNYVLEFQNVSITEKVVLADDGSVTNETQACSPLVNGAEMDGNIAMIDRGSCEFGRKSLNAQNAGAVAVLICNIPGVNNGDGEEGVNMGGGVDGPQVTIPAVFLKYSDCQNIKAVLSTGQDVVVTIMEREIEGPEYYSSSFDNGVIAHEFAHGISTRLTGGPSNSGCLPSFDEDGDGTAETGEQMGEGWSDFFGLITTVYEGDQGSDRRGVGVYVNGENENGRGIRAFPYSTDQSINPQTMNDLLSSSGVHATGAIWAAAIWDLYWAFVDLYGFDPDWRNTESGNFKAVQLVMDGMKFQPCAPGFMDGRDAILAADIANYNGENQCMIWDVFANRGMGTDADQMSSLTQRDNVEGFEPLATCIKEIKIQKDIAGILTPGAESEVVLNFVNHIEETQQNVTIMDEIPANSVFVSQNSTYDFEVVGNSIIFEIGDLDYLEGGEIRYTILSDASIKSAILYADDVEDDDLNNVRWDREIIEGLNFWQQSGVEDFSYSGFNSWYVSEVAEATRTNLIYKKLSVVGERPVLRFWHMYNTSTSLNGGYIEISTDGVIWNDVRRDFIRNLYPTTINYSTFVIPSLEGFSGNSNGFIDSYVDLSDYKDQDIMIRFKFGTDVSTNTFAPDNGWFVDDIDLIDLLEYETEACITSDNAQGCSGAKKSFIEASIITSANDIEIKGVNMTLMPNPAGDYTSILINSDNAFNAQLRLTSMDGQLIRSFGRKINKRENSITIGTSDLSAGVYILQLSSGDKLISKKLVIQ